MKSEIKREYQIVVFSSQEAEANDISDFFNQKGFLVSKAFTYQDLMACFNKGHQVVVIFDYIFPAFTGLHLLQRIKKDFIVIPAMVCILESPAEPAVIDEIIDAGVTDYIIKREDFLSCLFERINLTIARLENEKRIFHQLVNDDAPPNVIANFLDVIDDMVLIRELNGMFISMNKSTLAKLKYNRHELLIMMPEDLIVPQDVAEFKNAIRLLSTNRKHTYQTRIISKDNEVFPVEISSQLTRFKGKEVVVSIARDIRDRIENNEKLKKLNLELERMNLEYKAQNERLRNINQEIEENRHALKLALQEAENAEKLKNKFLANMSHEIRTPMNAIVGFSQLLHDADPEDVPEFVHIINSNSEILLQLINDLMDIAKIESDLVSIHPEDLMLNYMMKDIKTIFDFEKLNKGKRNIEIVYQQKEHLDLVIETDKLRFKQVLMNLMNNALKFTEKGRIEIGYTIENDFVHIFVKDTGVGVHPKMQHQIFERFRQVDHIQKPQGTGIGLSISRSLIRLLGGEITLISQLSEGSTFTIVHPLSQKNNIKVKPLQKNMVMIAEDEEDNYHLLKYVLKDLDLDVIWAKNGKEAIDYCREKKISLVLMDIKMPTLSGLEATREILRFQPELPIIAQTAYTQEDDIERCRMAGCVEFISKPINLTHLRTTIAKYI